jgi:uncharacterized repeat protein (TIGR04138 family)
MPHQHPIVQQLLEQDRRFSLEAYQFVRDALSFGQQVLNYGEAGPADEEPAGEEENPFLAAMAEEEEESDEPRVERHLTGQQLCEAIRQYALEQYGYMAKVVLNNWGIHSTGDFGEIVYNLIRVGVMKKSKDDRREDFNDCYSFDEALQQRYKITMPRQ